MNTQASALSPLFRSNAQGEILARIFLNPERSFTVAELARAAGTPYASAHREVARIVKMGLAKSEKRGQSLDIRVSTDSPLYRPLAEILRFTYGPPAILPRFLAQVQGIDEAYIYGSWAARREGEQGSAPNDLDVLLVGNPSRAEAYDIAQRAGSALGREVNVRILSPATWAAANDPFTKTLKKRPLVKLELKENAE
ncbi:hypothetical protein ACIQTZ_14650 [Paenarthrobacter sp. NPDC090520]|uniref:nucleotidyltransferase domain-containing protein n=1 Tax=unclassified Paenarthrobacter TaxID=2634190 RepID=UPI00380270FF